MPVMSVSYAVQWYIVDPHVQVGPINPHKEGHASNGSITTCPRQNQAHANGNFHRSSDENPQSWIAEHRRDNGFKPSGVCEVLNTNPHISEPKKDAA